MRRVSSHLVLTPSGLQPGRVVTVSDGGTILDVSEVAPSAAGSASVLDREAGVEFYSGILVPGFVNAHCHLELSHLRGAIPPGGGFTKFVEGMKAAPRTDRSGAAGFWDARMWAEGVQAVGDICNGEGTFALKQKSPIRYHDFREIFGAGATVPTDVPNLTPHSLYSLDRETFARIIERSTSRPLSIHFMESEYEVASPAERLISQVPADRAVLLVHNCLVTQRDIDIVMGHFTAPVTWVLCPASNLHISGLTPPVELLRKNGLNIAVGTDSLASNDSLSMIRELGLLGGTGAPDTRIPLEELLLWATLGGAKALGLDDTLGSIEPGKSPGLAVITGVDLEKLRLTENARAERIV